MNTLGMRMRRWIGCLAAAAAITMALLGCGSAPSPGAQQPTESGASAQDSTQQSSSSAKRGASFSLESVDGKTVSLSDYLGKNVVLLDFWATWCEPCLAAMPHLNDIFKRHRGEGFVLLSISMDGPDTVAEVRSYTRRHKLSFPVLLDEESRAVSLYNPKRSAPYAVLIGKDGAIIGKRDGYQPGDEAAIEAEIVEALGR